MSELNESEASTPPPLPVPSRGKPLAVASVVIAAVGAIPLLVYLLVCLFIMGGYGSFPLLLLMGFVGLLLHLLGLVLGIIGMSLGAKESGFFGCIANGIILALVLIGGFAALVGASL